MKLVAQITIISTLLGNFGEFNASALAPDSLPVPKIVDGRLQEALTSYTSGQFDVAIESLDRLAKSSSHGRSFIAIEDQAFFLKALSFQGLEKHEDAIREFKNSLKQKGSNSDVLLSMAKSQQEVGKLDDALQSVNESIWFSRFSIFGKDQAYGLAAAIYKAQNNPAKATEMLNKGLEVNAASPTLRMALSDIQSETGDKANAIQGLRDIIGKDPGNEGAKLKLARLLLTDANRMTDKVKISEARSLAQMVVNQPTIQNELEARTVYISSLILSGDLDSASEAFKIAQAKNLKSDELAHLEQQITVEKGGLASADKPQ